MDDKTANEQPTIERDEKGRFLTRPPQAVPITPERSREFLARREAKKHKAIQEAANLAANAELKGSKYAELRAMVGSDDAFLKAIAIGRTQAAMDSDSPYGNGAAEWIMTHTGNAEPRDVNVNIGYSPEVAEAKIMALLERARLRAKENGEAIEGEIVSDDEAE